MNAVLLLVTFLASAPPQPSGLETLPGRWRDDDRGTLVEFTADAAGAWTGTALEARRKEEVGRVVFRDLRFVAAENRFKGTLIRPDGGDEVSVTVTVVSATRMEAVVKKFFLSKTLVFRREDAGNGRAAPP